MSADAIDLANDALIAALDRIYDALEHRRFGDFAAAIGLDEIEVDGRRVPSDEVVAAAEDVLTDAEDISLFVLRVLSRQRVAADVVQRFTACLLWSPAGTWDDEEIEFDLTATLSADADGVWTLCSLAIGPATPEDIPFPDDPPGEDPPSLEATP